MMQLTTKIIGNTGATVPDCRLPVPPSFTDGVEPVTLRMLITFIVKSEVAEFNTRARQSHLVKVLTSEEIKIAAEKGKVNVTGPKCDELVDAEMFVATALQAFEDGIYLIFLDDEEQRELDREVYINEDCRIIFVRLTLLAGG